jgi:hypothetical protein
VKQVCLRLDRPPEDSDGLGDYGQDTGGSRLDDAEWLREYFLHDFCSQLLPHGETMTTGQLSHDKGGKLEDRSLARRAIA